jgi:hypothetical protein
MSFIIKCVYKNDIEKAISNVIQGPIPDQGEKKDEVINKIFEQLKWKSGLFETIKKGAIKSVIRDRITDFKTNNICTLLIRVNLITKRTLQAENLTIEKTNQMINEWSEEINKACPQFSTREIEFLIRGKKTREKMTLAFAKSKDENLTEKLQKKFVAKIQKVASINYNLAIYMPWRT